MADSPPRGEFALRLTPLPTGDDRVREHGIRPAAMPGAHAGDRGPHDCGVGALGRAEVVRTHGGLEIRDGVDRHAGDLDAPADVIECGRQMHAGRAQQGRREAQPGGRVVIAAAHDDARTGVDESLEGLREQAHRVRCGHGAVVDITRDEHRLDPLGPHDLHELIERARLHTQHPDVLERPAQVPVGGVQRPHGFQARWEHRQPLGGWARVA
jgi:hypothetical protein